MVNNMFIYIYARLSQTRRGGSQCWDLRFLYFFCLVTSFWGGNVFSFLFYILFEMFPSSLGFSNIWFSLLFIHGVFVCLLFLLFYNNFRHILFLFKRIEWQILLHKYKGQVISTYRDNSHIRICELRHTQHKFNLLFLWSFIPFFHVWATERDHPSWVHIWTTIYSNHTSSLFISRTITFALFIAYVVQIY